MKKRYLDSYLLRDLEKKMVFVGGPRQCGKTTLAMGLLKIESRSKGGGGRSFNWDDDEERRRLLDRQWKETDRLLVFDELHKFSRWKSWLKGIYDTSRDRHRFLVTGSARLDVYRRGGDSLMGRYHYWRLHPFTLSEIPAGINHNEALSRLMTVGGFPEPFLDGDEREARRWRKERFDRTVKDDIRDLEPLRSISTLSLFVDLLRRRVGGLVVLSNLANELQVTPKTAKHWLEVLERMYMVFTVRPYTQKIARAVLKPPKVYFFDNGDVVGDEGARFENLVATTLLKRIHFLEDVEGYRYELRYIRDKEGREVDFVILREGEVEELVEVKYHKEEISPSLLYYSERLNPPRATQIVATLKRGFGKKGISIETPFESLTESPWKRMV